MEVFDKVKFGKLVGKFLEHRSESDGGWAPVGDNDIDDLRAIVDMLIQAKYEQDPDGDIPIDIKILDRTKYESSYYFPILYSHRDYDDEELQYRILEDLAFNASAASEALSRHTKLMKSIRYQKSTK